MTYPIGSMGYTQQRQYTPSSVGYPQQTHYANHCHNCSPANPIQQLTQALVQVVKQISHMVAEPIYSFAKNNPALYGAGVAGASLSVGMMACPYAGASMAAVGAMGYANSQNQI